jgi:hypothetical protein
MRNLNLAFPADVQLWRVFFASEASGPQKANCNLILVELGELKEIFFWTYGPGVASAWLSHCVR